MFTSSRWFSSGWFIALLVLLPFTMLLSDAAASASPIDDLKLTQLDGTPLPSVAGKVVLFVNVASKCGHTPQYAGLQSLYTKYQDRGLVLVGAPCNQFGGQEPGTAEEIKTFCSLNYGVTFPLLQKQDVNGAGRSALYSYLVGSTVGANTDVKWNFEKFLVSKAGAVVGRYLSAVKPDDAKLITDIERELAK